MHEAITNNLDLWASALLTKSTAGRGSNGKQEAYGVKKLRELILELAVRGRLVPQDPEEEPGVELLKKVSAEQARMVKEGKIKKEKDFPGIVDEEVPFDLPGGWEWARINDVGHDWGQKTPDANFTYIDVSSIDNSLGVISSPSVLSASDAPSRARKIVTRGTVIYSTVRPYLRNICVIEEDYSPEPIASTAFAILHPFQGMPGRFFALYFRSPEFVKYVESVQTGIAYPAINDKQFYGGIVPVPPLAEQHRIVTKVDELMALCDQLEQQQTHSIESHQTLVENLLGTLTHVESQQELIESWTRIANHFDTLFTNEDSLDQLKQTILQLAVMGVLVKQVNTDTPVERCINGEAITKRGQGKGVVADLDKEIADNEIAFNLPEHWKWIRLGKVVEITGGSQPPKSKFIHEPKEGYTRLIQIRDFKSDDFPTYVSDEFANRPFNEDDIMIGRYGPPVFQILRGKKGTYNVALMKADPIEKCISKDFLFYLLSEPRIQNLVISESERTAGQSGVRKELLYMFVIGLPPIEEQHRIVAKVDELMALCDALKARLNDAQTTQVHLADAIVEQAVV
jgi:type I restriction enzyme S subunit